MSLYQSKQTAARGTALKRRRANITTVGRGTSKMAETWKTIRKRTTVKESPPPMYQPINESANRALRRQQAKNLATQRSRQGCTWPID